METKFDNGYLCLEIKALRGKFYVMLDVNNDFPEIPTWFQSVSVLQKSFNNLLNAEKYFSALKELIEKEEMPKDYVKVSVMSYNKGHEGEVSQWADYYCRPEDAETLSTFHLKHHEKECFSDLEEAKRFYDFCLSHDVLDSEFNHPSDVENFYIVGIGTIDL